LGGTHGERKNVFECLRILFIKYKICLENVKENKISFLRKRSLVISAKRYKLLDKVKQNLYLELNIFNEENLILKNIIYFPKKNINSKILLHFYHNLS